MIATGVAFHLFWISWVAGAFFGLVVGYATMMQADLQRKNNELSLAQEEVRALAVTAERERISRDLHDLLGRTLTLVAVKAELAARLVVRDAAGAEREMQAVAAAARAALAEVRTAVIGMRGASLTAEIERAREMLAAANVSAEISVAAPTGDPQREAVLAMALREAVTNVIRHSSASRCRIRLDEGRAGELRLCVEDNGTGCSATGLEEGSGLTGMRARLAALGGALEISSGRRGTRLRALAPALSRVAE
jgi:two-component system sensor histidine kinase DesK